MRSVRLSSKNQIVHPREAQAMHLKGRDELLVIVKGGITLIMPKPEKYSSELAGSGDDIYGGDYLRKERKAW